MQTKSGKEISVVGPRPLYKWARNFKRIQDRFYLESVKLRRIKQIEDFIILNGYKKIFHIDEVILDLNIPNDRFVYELSTADLILVTDQKFSRYPLSGIIEKICDLTSTVPDAYICLNRHYLNIDNQRVEMDLPQDYQQAITAWLSSSLPDHVVVDMSRNYLDIGRSFTWVCPDRHYYIRRIF